MSALVVIAVADLMFQPRIEAAARELGFDTAVADSTVEARAALARRPTLVVVDLHATQFDPEAVIRAGSAIGAKVLAFGRHTEPGVLRAARQAGAAAAVPRSELVERLHELIGGLAGPQARDAKPV